VCARSIQAKIKEATAAETEAEAAVNKLLHGIGNLVHDSVPVHDDEDFNKIEKTWGEPREAEKEGVAKFWNHVDLVTLLDIVNLEKGQEVAGGRGYFLKGEGALLNLALINYAIGFLTTRNYTVRGHPRRVTDS
jgi:seryl-tRNA synthetase